MDWEWLIWSEYWERFDLYRPQSHFEMPCRAGIGGMTRFYFIAFAMRPNAALKANNVSSFIEVISFWSGFHFIVCIFSESKHIYCWSLGLQVAFHLFIEAYDSLPQFARPLHPNEANKLCWWQPERKVDVFKLDDSWAHLARSVWWASSCAIVAQFHSGNMNTQR